MIGRGALHSGHMGTLAEIELTRGPFRPIGGDGDSPRLPRRSGFLRRGVGHSAGLSLGHISRGTGDSDHRCGHSGNGVLRPVSKTLTAVAIMRLVEEGKLDLDDRVAPFIAHLTPAPGATVDPRWEQVTIRHLLNHTGGWDRTKPNGGFDPFDRPVVAAVAVGAPVPASAETLIRWAYSTFGYLILGRVIERVSGMPYAEHVRARVLQPLGADRTQQGRSRMSDALPGEVRYYMPLERGLGMTAPLVPPRPGSDTEGRGRRRFTFVRARYAEYRGWRADYPMMEQNLATMLREMTTVPTDSTRTNVYAFDDPELNLFPIAYLSEPGCWYPTESEVLGFAPVPRPRRLPDRGRLPLCRRVGGVRGGHEACSA